MSQFAPSKQFPFLLPVVPRVRPWRTESDQSPARRLSGARLHRWAAHVLISLLGVVGAIGLDYQDNGQLASQLQQLTSTHPTLVRLQSVAKTANDLDVWLLEIGSGSDAERSQRPALLLVAAIEGNDLAGTVSAVSWAGSLAVGFATNAELKTTLETTTIYIFPRPNPEAAQNFFAKPTRETLTNTKPFDDDRDGLVDEDGLDDLDGDGLITWMRVQDPDGTYILDPVDPRLLIEADKAKGEVGAWKLFTEGRDEDGDEEFNEDGPGGVNLNRNFPYNYKFFAPDAGLHQVSEVETRALADFIVEHPNIGIVLTFGSADNLVQTPKADDKSESIEEAGGGSRRGRKPPTALHSDDLPFYRELGKAYRDALGLKKELKGASAPGTFSDWMYYHRGRLSLAARAWDPAIQVELSKAASSAPKEENADADAEAEDKPSAEPDAKDSESSKPESDKRNETDRAFVKWLDANAPESFVTWKPFDHPGFPGRTVEVGGFAPYAKSNPPARLLDELAAKHGKFLTELLGKLPRAGIREAKAKHLGASVHELTLRVENSGYLPTALAQGVLTREVLPARVVLDLDDKEILSGTRVTLLDRLDGSGGSKELRYIVLPDEKNSISIEVISALGGSVRTNVVLTQER